MAGLIKLILGIVLFGLLVPLHTAFASNNLKLFQPMSDENRAKVEFLNICPPHDYDHRCVWGKLGMSKSLYLINDYIKIRDQRIKVINSWEREFGSSAVIDLIFYYEYMTYAMSLLVEGQNSTAETYTKLALEKLENAVEAGLEEASIEKGFLLLDRTFYDEAPEVEELLLNKLDENFHGDYSCDAATLLRNIIRDEQWDNLEPYKTIYDNHRCFFVPSHLVLNLFSPYPLLLPNRNYDKPLQQNLWVNEGLYDDDGVIEWRCALFDLAENMGDEISYYRKRIRCNHAIDKYVEKLMIEAEQNNIGARLDLAYFFLRDDDSSNDSLGLEWMKSGVLNRNLSPYELTEFYSFNNPDIEECNIWASKLTAGPSARLEVLGWGTGRFVRLTTSNGCFLPIAEVNGKKYNFERSFRYGYEIIIDRDDIDGCMEFANAKVFFHPEYKYKFQNDYITTSEYVKFNCGDDENMGDFIKGKKNVYPYLNIPATN